MDNIDTNSERYRLGMSATSLSLSRRDHWLRASAPMEHARNIWGHFASFFARARRLRRPKAIHQATQTAQLNVFRA